MRNELDQIASVVQDSAEVTALAFLLFAALLVWRAKRGGVLITMRLADMHVVHPDQITGKCADCDHEVGIYPSGQAAMREHPKIRVVCQVCRLPGPAAHLAPGAEAEPFQSVRKKP